MRRVAMVTTAAAVAVTMGSAGAAGSERSAPAHPSVGTISKPQRKVRVRLLSHDQARVLGSRVLRLRVWAPDEAIVRLTATAGHVRAGRVRHPITIARGPAVELKGKWTTLKLRLSKRGLRLLRRCGAVRLTITARRFAFGGERRPAPRRTSRTLRPPAHCHSGHVTPIGSPQTAPGGNRGNGGSGGGTGGGGSSGSGGSQAAAVFSVGAATRSIKPPSAAQATHVGGYGDCKGCPTTDVTPGDDVTVRALAVRRGRQAEVVVTADLEGWFAGYKQGPHLGLVDLRADIAGDLSAEGLDAKSSDVIVQSVHCHACPTVVGIWGPTNLAYLRFVYAQARAAVLDALHRARPAVMTWQTGDIGYVNDVVVPQANANEGWPIDGQLSILRAVDARSGAPIVTWAEVPAHGNIVFGPGQHTLSSDYFGAADRWLEKRLGGVAIVGPSTLGDQTTPMQGDKDPQHVLGVVARLGALVGSTVQVALRDHPHLISDPHLGSAETYLPVPYTNPLLSGDDCNDQIEGVVGIQLDRSCQPPYSVSAALLGAWFTTLRIGPVAIASEPGEAFPHVTFAVRRVLSGAAAVFTPGQAQDQLGYYYEPWAFPTTFVYSADHNIFHASMALAEANAQVQVPNGTGLGFSVSPSADDPTGNDFTRVTKPGVQAWGYPQPLGASPPHRDRIWIGVYRGDARSTQVGAGGNAPDPMIDFGDGSAKQTVKPLAASPCCAELEHTFPHPGDWKVTASLPGTSESWTTTVHVLDASTVWNSATYPAHGVLGP